MFANRLVWRQILCSIAALSISALAVAQAPHMDHQSPIPHKPSRRIHHKAVAHAAARTAAATASGPLIRTNPQTGCKQVELCGVASSYLKPLGKLMSQKGVASKKNVELDVEKSHRLLKLIVDGHLVKTYVTGLSRSPDAPKVSVGDKATPTGDYYVCQKNPYSRFYLALKLSYPNTRDAERGFRSGMIDSRTCTRIKSAIEAHQAPPMDTRLGGNICIHGGGAGKLERMAGVPVMNIRDWTAGCIALDNAQMKELFEFVPLGTRVHITS